MPLQALQDCCENCWDSDGNLWGIQGNEGESSKAVFRKKNQGISSIFKMLPIPFRTDFQSSALPTELPRQDVGRGYETATSYSNEAEGNVKQLFLRFCLTPDPNTSGRGFLETEE